MNKEIDLTKFLIVLTILSLFCLIYNGLKKTPEENALENKKKVEKILNLVYDANSQILEYNKDNLPKKAFIAYNQRNGKKEICDNKLCSNLANPLEFSSEELRELFAEYIKFKETNDDFGINYTAYVGIEDELNHIYGGKTEDNIYVGFKIIDEVKIGNCNIEEGSPLPKFVKFRGDIELMQEEDPNTKDTCWAKIFIDTNGIKEPNADDFDFFVYGLKVNELENN